MAQVGKKKFAYTKKGMAKAKAFAKKTGKKLVKKKGKGKKLKAKKSKAVSRKRY